MLRRDFTTRIQNAADAAECEVIAAEIVAERPDQVLLLFAQLHRRRSALASNGGDHTNAEREAWVATALQAAFRGARDHRIRVLPEAGGDSMGG